MRCDSCTLVFLSWTVPLVLLVGCTSASETSLLAQAPPLAALHKAECEPRTLVLPGAKPGREILVVTAPPDCGGPPFTVVRER